MIVPTCFGPSGPSSGSLSRTLLKLQFCADIQKKYFVKCSAMLVKSVSNCSVYCVPCTARYTVLKRKHTNCNIVLFLQRIL